MPNTVGIHITDKMEKELLVSANPQWSARAMSRVMAILGHQLDYIWNELEPKWLCTPVGHYFPLIKSLDVGRSTFNQGHPFRWQPRKRTWEKEAGSVCLLALASKSIPSLVPVPAGSQHILRTS